MRRKLSAVSLALFALVFVLGSDVRAQNKCAGDKIKAACKKFTYKAGLVRNQASKGGTIDPAKVAKCEAAFSTSFAKSEAKGFCSTTGDAAAIESKIDAFVVDLDTELNVATGTNPNECESDKIKAAAKKASCKCALEAKQASEGGTIDPAKVAKCEATFSKKFARSDAKGGCNTTGDAAAIEAKVDAFVIDVDTEIPGTPYTWLPPCAPPGAPPLCDGDCGPGMACIDAGTGGTGTCGCVPTGMPCGIAAAAPTCWGACPFPGGICFFDPGAPSGCVCAASVPTPVCSPAVPGPACDGDCGGAGSVCIDGPPCMCAPFSFPCGFLGPPICWGDCPAGTACVLDADAGACVCF